MNDGPGVRPVQHRREYPNLPSRKQSGQQKKDDKEEENGQEEPRKGPPSPDGSSTIDVTA